MGRQLGRSHSPLTLSGGHQRRIVYGCRKLFRRRASMKPAVVSCGGQIIYSNIVCVGGGGHGLPAPCCILLYVSVQKSTFTFLLCLWGHQPYEFIPQIGSFVFYNILLDFAGGNCRFAPMNPHATYGPVSINLYVRPSCICKDPNPICITMPWGHSRTDICHSSLGDWGNSWGGGI